jgi:putative ABC transport system permease protein
MRFSLLGYALRNPRRHPLRTVLTLLGIASAMFLFVFIEGLQAGVRQATEHSATENVLIVYQKSRFCPATSNLPERYATEIEQIPGVMDVLPVKMFVNNCRASLDSVTFRGVPPEKLTSGDKPLKLIAGSMEEFESRTDAALVGQRLASRRGLSVGSQFGVSRISARVAGIFTSDVPGEDNIAYTRLEFLQRQHDVEALGRVTQFDVTVADPAQAGTIAARIDKIFRTDEVPTTTKTHKAFVSFATGDLLGLLRFTRHLGILSVLVVLALVANTVFMAVQERVKEHAVLQTLGFPGMTLLAMILAESLAVSLAGGLLGTGAAAALLHWGRLGLGAEGINVTLTLTPLTVATGLVASTATGLLAGLLPALQAALAPISGVLRRA